MVRPIDGNKLVENLRLIATCWSISPFASKEKHNGAVDMLREVEREVKEAPVLVLPDKWISVKDRLPESDLPKDSTRLQIKVLVAIKAKNGYTIRTQNRMRRKKPWDSKEHFTDWYWKYSYGNVTHWMLLPEPPKEMLKDDKDN